MLYHSTRSVDTKVDSAQAVLSGLAPDGGLYVPQQLPTIDVAACLQEDTMSMAARIIGAMLPDIENMDDLVRKAYTGKFQTEELTPTVDTGKFTVLELFRGPTSAFKDVALCMLPQLLTKAKTQKGMAEDILILTATSGDTGKAALAGFQDVAGVKICVFYPDGGVSKVQRAQMVTQEGSNVAVCAVKGNFDDAQTGVKNIFAAAENGCLPGGNCSRLSTANSINIGRLAPQITYYFKAYADLLKRGRITMGDKVNFCVPTGNFGDILAGWLAKKLGLPVGKLVCASNANNILTEFIRTGTYDRRRPLHKTISPSMDILVSSNLERLLFFMSGGDTALVAQLMGKLNREGVYTVPEEMKDAISQEFWAGFCDDAQASKTIEKVFKEQNYLCDTHTATGWAVAESYVAETGDHRPMVVLSTASPYKFPAAVLTALEGEQTLDEFAMMDRLQEKTGVPIPQNLSGLQEKKERHTGVIEKDKMLEFVMNL
ncbi:MAG: threonine synthase [Oscillospiraceae bacterium]|nr:threonine synthase [Oscillospiraceae bacterium]